MIGGKLVKKKLRQVTDNIHGTIYLSDLESELISTPYFYRLHDIYQSSTVYMTYPSNRTKRYEHSIGTMEIASSMIYSAISNANNKTREMLFKRLNQYFCEIIDEGIMKSEEQVAPYFTKCRDQINPLFYRIGDKNLKDFVKEEIKEALENGCFIDNALDHFQYYPIDVEKSGKIEYTQDIFLYRCLLQAIRIVALFHDVGHPPYSHIIEEVLQELYFNYENVKGESEWQKEALRNFRECLAKYMTSDPKEAYQCQTIYSKKSLIDAKPHERIGLSLLQSAINDIIPQVIINIVTSSKDKCCKIASIIYYIMVVEFTIAILVEKNIVFKSFHTIVDGIIDADRLDYIMRDSLNSGVDWGKIPYKRIINSAKLFYLEKDGSENGEDKCPFVMAYPKKVADDIEDLLIVRYKIFARINFHHRCMKTSVALQSSVMKLAENYLNSKSKNECINPDIHVLWDALKTSIGGRTTRVIQWNDSWLISVLHKALVELIMREGLSDDEKVLEENLEEILLNRKRYYSLFKRGKDSKKFIDKVFQKAGITEGLIKELSIKEYKKYIENRTENANDSLLEAPKYDAEDSIRRISQLRKAQLGDMEALWRPLPLIDESVKDCMEKALLTLRKEDKILDYKVIINEGKQKTGTPKHKDLFDEIYLYNGERCDIFDDRITLRDQIEAIERNVLWIYIYFVPPLNCNDINDLSQTIISKLAEEVGDKLKGRFEELFSKVS